MSTNTYRIHEENESHLKEARLPLLTEDCANEHPPDVKKNIQEYAFGLGLLVGTFMQLSALLVAKFLLIALLSQEGLHSSIVETMGLPLLCGFGASTMAVVVVVLVFMCKRVSSVMYDNMSNGGTQISEDDSLQDLLRKFECSFIKGAICGVCMASGAATCLLVSWIVFPLMLTWLSCFVFFCCCDSGNDDDKDDEENEKTSEEDFHIQSSDGYQNCMVV
jgi:hypothetical protein